MKLKLAIIFGILIWIITFAVTQILNPIFTHHLPQINIVVPVIMNLTTVFFGILYIRNIDTNEVVEGFLAGEIFIREGVLFSVIYKQNPEVIRADSPLQCKDIKVGLANLPRLFVMGNDYVQLSH